MTGQRDVDPKLQARVLALKRQARAIADEKEAGFMAVIEAWLANDKPNQPKDEPRGDLS